MHLGRQPTTDLGIGEHLFAVRAVDEFGNLGVSGRTSEFVVTPPEAKILSAPASGTTTTATFQFTSEPFDADAVFYCSLDDRPFGLCTAEPVDGEPGVYRKTYTNLFPGEHIFQVQTLFTGLDWMGLPFEHDPIPAMHTWTVQDFTAPETTIDFGPPATTLSASAYLQVSSDDPTATIECTLTGPAGTESGECEPGVVTEFTDLVPGDYTFTAVATDLSGNVDPSPATHSWTIAPAGAANTPVGEPVLVTIGNVSVSFFSVDTAGTTIADRIFAGPPLPEGYAGASTHVYDIPTTAEYSEPINICISYNPADFEGAQTLRLLHFDGELWIDVTTLHNPFVTPARICSNIAEDFGLFAIAIASTGSAPETSILSGPEGPLGPEGLPTSTSGSATFEFWTDQAPDAITQCSIDGDPFFFCESPLTVGPLEEGDHEFIVQAINAFGWMDLTPAIYEWEIIGPDVTPPTTIDHRRPAGGLVHAELHQHLHLQRRRRHDAGPRARLRVHARRREPRRLRSAHGGDRGRRRRASTPCSSRRSTQPDNIDPVGAIAHWTVIDMSGPDTEIILGPEEETTETSATFEFEGFELLNDLPVNEFECALDDGEFAACETPFEIAGPLGGGVHVFHVRAVDPDGNRDISPAFYEWLIIGADDTTPPETFITVYPDQANSGPDVIFGFASNEPVESFECSYGEGTPPPAPTTWEECEVVWFLEGLDSGQHWLWVRALDIAEIPNVDPTPAGASRGFPAGIDDPAAVRVGHHRRARDHHRRRPDDPTGAYTATFEFQLRPGRRDLPLLGQRVAARRLHLAVPGRSVPAGRGRRARGARVRGLRGQPVPQRRRRAGPGPVTGHLHWTVQDVAPPETVFLGAAEIGPEQFVEPGLRFTFRGIDDLGSSFELEFECAFTNTTETSTEVWEECGEPAAGDSFFHDIAFEELTPGAYTFQVRALDLPGNHDLTPAPEPAYEFGVEAEPETTLLSVTPDMGLDLETTCDQRDLHLLRLRRHLPVRARHADLRRVPGRRRRRGHLRRHPLRRATGTSSRSSRSASSARPTRPRPSSSGSAGPMSHPTLPSISRPHRRRPAAPRPRVSIEFSSTDPDATFLCTLDGIEVQCAEPGYEYSDLLAGEQNPHTFEIEATRADLLPSVTTNVATHEWVINDDAAPTAVLLAPLPTDPSGNDVTFAFTGSDNGTHPDEPRIRVLARRADPRRDRGRVRALPVGGAALGADRRQPHLRGSRDRRDPPHRRSREPHLGRHRAAADGHHQHDHARRYRPRWRDQHERDRHAVLLRPARLDLRVPPRPDRRVRPGLHHLHLAAARLRPVERHACARGPRADTGARRAADAREPGGGVRVDDRSGRHDRSADDPRPRPGRRHDEHLGDLRLQRHRQPDRGDRHDLRVLARRRSVRRVRERRRVSRPRAWRPHVRGPRG